MKFLRQTACIVFFGVLGACMQAPQYEDSYYEPLPAPEDPPVPYTPPKHSADCHEFPEKCKAEPKTSSQDKVCNPLTEACGPFPQALRDLCHRRGGGQACLTANAWDKEFYEDLVNSLGTPSKSTSGAGTLENATLSIPARLYEYYISPKNFLAVQAGVKSFHSPFTKEGCVAFISTALRKIGVNIPVEIPTSVRTSSFSDYLIKKLGWRKITNINELVKGDVVFTVDDTMPGVPEHVMMFAGWQDQKAKIAKVIDNQLDLGHIHNRALTNPNDKLYDFWYIVRP